MLLNSVAYKGKTILLIPISDDFYTCVYTKSDIQNQFYSPVTEHFNHLQQITTSARRGQT